MVTQRCKRLGDFVAGTHVVRDRFRLSLPPPPQMPPMLAHWAAQADLASLRRGCTRRCAGHGEVGSSTDS